MSDQSKRPAVFVDRDGTLIEEVNFLSNVENLKIFPFTRTALETLQRNGYLVIVVTNQSGIGRKIYDTEAMNAIHKQMTYELPGLIDAFYHCPHLPFDGCSCRKPGLGMIEAARDEFSIDMRGSWMIGDKIIDVETGFNAGIRTGLVRTGYGLSHEAKLERQPDIVADDLSGVVERMLTLSG
ncbi:MAG TPA: HAD family hydrolase [Pyrinomonadaceae bacterium]|nr:HAD family hydrolase [Pyrinomonadaceae bacterium]